MVDVIAMLFRFIPVWLLSISGFLIASPIYAQTPLTAATTKLPQGARYSLLIEDAALQQNTLELNTHLYYPPASTQKILTALAAKLELGDEFRFHTDLMHLGQDWIIRFSGDPTLTTADLTTLLKAMKAQSGGSIEGDLWLDNSVFNGYERAVGWPWDILGVCYSAPASAINLDGNCIQASIYTEPQGKTRVYVPEHYPVHVQSQAISVTQSEQESLLCDLELTATPENHYKLDGCLALRDKPLPLKFAVQDTGIYTQRVVYRLLSQLNIELKGKIKVGKANTKQAQKIASHHSQPLPVLLKTMLQESDNLIADTLTKALGHRFYSQPGSFTNGTQAIKQIFYSRTGISLEDTQLADGSGLSRNNRMRPQVMLETLRYLYQHEAELGLIAMLPSAGESGTLQYRRSMRAPQISGQIKAKSGSLYGTYNMAGFVMDENQRPKTLFVQFVTDYFPPKSNPEVAVEPPIIQFETQLYQELIQFNRLASKPN
ncbi:serine-type D-Ala-D-Ala carboxypeptidase [Vibrio cholerae]|nr:serine-type D-Ala-D-Ala carboxypeptidase [Vibrio cholerae]EGR0259281.1 serine-type D-Ala-D-Ala carboxypeptidase [Vibrio cholerae]EGR0418333.1 serine-type D-Ala-D-Ala carboxypeptidase [Vibrio cholerae]EGR0489860.1 serine-type D-Ala-D-Ala carboxypeptidase [Vibrio cholerae]EGR0588122.1 serine-type D-Ala-D-Ala carboxypeptidase [Vibrio cholerae]